MREREIQRNRQLQLAFQWAGEVQGGEMIQTPGYSKIRFVPYPGVSTKALDKICEIVNLWYEELGSDFRISRVGGEIRPGVASNENEKK
jgi:hypothetical protein